MQRGSTAADHDEQRQRATLPARAGQAAAATICVCIDDVGLQLGINDAALELAGLGRVHALSCMVGAPAWAPLRPALRSLDAHGMDLGLHLDLTEHPLLAGSRHGLWQTIAGSYLGRFGMRALSMEIHAQLAAFEDAVGHAPAFVDGHQHVHQLPLVRGALLDALERRYGDFKPWLRATEPPAWPQAGWRERFKPALIAALGGRALRTLAGRRGHAMNRHLLGVYDFQGGTERYQRLLHRWLAAAGEGDLLMCHPAQQLHPGDPIGEARLAEYQALRSPAFGRQLLEAGVDAWPMSQIVLHRQLSLTAPTPGN